ncbi:nuclease-related domain-containing protein [Vitreoscilla stercoraria]|uniref:NERD domain-containing protein n=1 Tax=Vitreoscilla stercoraria TaxID=61 RepID=A0ABY4EBN0_VITST|nr:nuclease-related domain-containing protein [Vitreoscilla stercoraria]UOO93151.1 NERD domain-containing protein [Vitreoscilla stercoraria]
MLTDHLLSSLSIAFIIILVLLICMTIFKKIKSPAGKGAIGENLLKLHLRKLGTKKYQVLNNVTLPTDDGTTQIDHIVLSPFGLFVIETKNMQGWIFGESHQAQWTQKFPTQSFSFQNPLRQNYKHTQTLIESLNLKPSTVHSIIAFHEKAKFKQPRIQNVLYFNEVVSYIQQHQKTVFSTAEISAIHHKIQAIRKPNTRKTQNDHIQHLKNKHTPKKP